MAAIPTAISSMKMMASRNANWQKEHKQNEHILKSIIIFI